jgi:tetratricopeptide (TPR) repeat protein
MSLSRKRKAASDAPPALKLISVDLPEDYARDMAAQMRMKGSAAEADAVVSMLDSGGAVRVEMPVEQALEVAISLHRTKRHEAAEEYYRKVLKADAAQARGRHFLGVLLHQTQRSDEGLKHLRRSLDALSDHAWAWNNLGNVHKERGDRAAAADAYREALRRDPDFAEAHCNLGVVLRDAKNWEEADQSYARAIALKPDYSEAWYNRGKLMFARGRVAEAIELLSKSMVLGTRRRRLCRQDIRQLRRVVRRKAQAPAVSRP